MREVKYEWTTGVSSDDLVNQVTEECEGLLKTGLAEPGQLMFHIVEDRKTFEPLVTVTGDSEFPDTFFCEWTPDAKWGDGGHPELSLEDLPEDSSLRAAIAKKN